MDAVQDEKQLQAQLMEILEAAAVGATRQAAFDIVLIAGLPPLLAIGKEVVRMPGAALSAADIGAVLRMLMQSKVARALHFDPVPHHEVQFVTDISGLARYRVAAFRQRGDWAAVLRPISRSAPSLEALGLPQQVTPFLRRKRGLILVAGPSAAGKSTTLAAMVDHISRNMVRHIVGVENPVEYTHAPHRSIISQRSIPEDTPSYSRAVRGALRQVPDVLVIGDLVDKETAEAALGAAESGHLVIASVHSKDAGDALQRVLGYFAPAQRRQVQVQMANSLLMLLVQQLISTQTAQGRVVATELLIATSGVRHLIRTGQTHRLNTMLQTGRSLGMHTMEDSLVAFTRSGLIEYGDALTATADAGLFLNLFRKRVQEEKHRGLSWTKARGSGAIDKPGAAAYGAAQPTEQSSYRTDLVTDSLEGWSSNGLLFKDNGALHFMPDPFQATLYAQVTDYSIWLGRRSPFRLANYARIIIQARPADELTTQQAGHAGAVPTVRVWLLIMPADGSVVTLPPAEEPGVDLQLNDLWQTLHLPIMPEDAEKEVRAYALRASRPDVCLSLREVFFG